MSDAVNTEFTPEELLDHAQANATAFTLTTIAYLKHQHLAVDAFVAFAGRHFASGWEQLRGQPVTAIARIAALNVVSIGGTLQSFSGDDTRAEVRITGWPDEGWLREFGLTQHDTDPLWNIFHPIMDYLGIRYSWQRQNDSVLMTFARQPTT